MYSCIVQSHISLLTNSAGLLGLYIACFSKSLSKQILYKSNVNEFYNDIYIITTKEIFRS